MVVVVTYHRGDLVEFTTAPVGVDYPPVGSPLVLFGVVVADTDDESPEVMMADRQVRRAVYVHSYGWAGWVPEGLDPILAEICGGGYSDWEDV